MEEPFKNSDISDLRSDFEVYKTQITIFAWIGVAIIFILICILIYLFIVIRRLRIQFNEKHEALERKAKFTIDRPKLLQSSSLYEFPFASDRTPTIASLSTSFNYKEISKPKVPSNNELHPPRSPSYNGNVSTPLSFDYRRPHRPKNIQIPPEDIQVHAPVSPNEKLSPSYENLKAKKPPNLQLRPDELQSPKTPSPNVNKPENYKRVNENFLNKNRALYSPKEEHTTSQVPSRLEKKIENAKEKM